MAVNWDKYPNFSKEEFDCKHTGINRMRPEFLDILQEIRTAYNRPMIINSGYRGKDHPVEKRKSKPGTHTYGIAVDVRAHGNDALDLVVIAYGLGVRRFGFKQNGKFESRFIHMDIGDQNLGYPQSIWSY